MKPLKIFGGIIGAIVIVALLLLVIGMPVGFLTSAIVNRVERQTGYHLTTAGTTKVGLWPSFNVTMREVTLEGPNDRETGNHLTVGSIQADMTLASLWSDSPEITELVIDRPDIRIPLHRERRSVAKPSQSSTAANTGSATPTIHRITVSGGTATFFNTRDHVEDRIEAINARATIDADRHLNLDGKATAGAHPLAFTVKASMGDPSAERQTIPIELSLDAPGLLQAPLTSEAEVRINGTTVMINGLSGKIGDDPFDGWASVDLASKPLVKVDLNFRRLDIATATSQAAPAGAPPAWSNDRLELAGLNYVDAQVRLSTAELNIGSAHFAPVALEASLASGILKSAVSNVGAYGGQANATIDIDVSSDKPAYAIRSDLTGVRALPLLSAAADFDKLDGKLQAKIDVRTSGESQQAIMSGLTGNVTANFQDGAIRGLNVAQMIRQLASGTLSGWQASQEKTTDLTQLSASFRIDNGRANTTDLNLVGPLVKMTGSGLIDIGAKTMALRVEPEARDDHRRPGTRERPSRLRHSRCDRRAVGVAEYLSRRRRHCRRQQRGQPTGGNSLSDTIGSLIQQGLNAARRANPNSAPNNASPDDPQRPSNNQINDIMKQLFGR